MFTGKSVLITPDEWSHLFAKAAIPDASFPSVLTTSFYRRNQIFTLGGRDGGREYALNLAMSFIGGIAEEEFDTVFGAASLGGLYDRFLFGRAPNGFKWNYQPCPIPQAKHWLEWNLKPVRVDQSVYDVIRGWNKENSVLGRVAEICTRIAVIYASLDGRPEITEQSQLDKDIAALRSHVIDGIEELKSSTGDVNSELTQANKILRRLFAVVSIIACLIAIHLIRHW